MARAGKTARPDARVSAPTGCRARALDRENFAKQRGGRNFRAVDPSVDGGYIADSRKWVFKIPIHIQAKREKDLPRWHKKAERDKIGLMPEDGR